MGFERPAEVAPVLHIINDELEQHWFLSPRVRGGCRRGILDTDVQVCIDDSGDIKRKRRAPMARHHLPQEVGKVLVGGYN